MKTCRVKPMAYTCRMCCDTDDYFGVISDCNKCSYNTTEYELLQIGKGIFGAYAFVLANGEVQQVSLDRVYDIKERGDKNDR